ncbi:FAD binding domain-containing protein [Paraburkholderia sp. MMS20-SJTN17]|uniref:FAD binding domain-containing protein n=1 Tax=Paraburkholderia translucens TaxID=2886945 RepID=A0ABS8KLE6_9BURK|nr:FAD binding domain-containing protein [Paraburkholderia sp. MMS20-SJTN17]MCC8405598.1 FAD binding domain-containing protein [Paraburkholderia sp. MMS20-SJTN17]
MNYFRARTVDEVLGRLAERPPPRVICGATDLFADPALLPAKYEWVDISRVDALRAIERRDGMARIGSATTWEAIAATEWLPTALREAAASVGSRQIRVQGSIGGNLCHASPVADGVPPLLALDAHVELASTRGVRRLPLTEFLLGRRRTSLHADELLVAVWFALPRAQDRTAFIKCTNRDGAAIAVVSAAVRLRMSGEDTMDAVAISVGGVSETALRMRELEAAMQGQRRAGLARAIEEASLVELTPIDDCRAPAAHRIHLARLAIGRAFSHCIKETDRGVSTA